MLSSVSSSGSAAGASGATAATGATGAPRSPTAGSPRISAGELAELIDDFAVEADRRTYAISDRAKWPSVDRALLDEDQVSALRFITFIEDHTPGYFAEYQRLFPFLREPGGGAGNGGGNGGGDGAAPAGSPASIDELLYNREMHRFTTRWAVDEERHAHLLFKYQVHAGVADADELRRQLVVEGIKPFALEQREHIAAIVAYTVIQEKATQIFYRNFEKRTQEPLLGEILTTLGRDESRHFAFFCRLLDAYLREAPESSLAAIKEVLVGFKMPLSSTLKGYWRWALRVSDAMGYDHTEAYEHLLRTVERTVDAAGTAPLRDFVREVRKLP